MRKAFLNTGSLLGILFLASSFLLGQEIRLDISMEDTTIEAVIQKLRIETEVDFIYNHEELQKCPRVSIHRQNASVDEILSHCLENTELDFERRSNTIIITPKPVQASPGKKLRTQTLRGTVRDRDSGQPLPFASVAIMNTQPMRGNITDEEGNFRFEKLAVGRYTLKISYVGL